MKLWHEREKKKKMIRFCFFLLSACLQHAVLLTSISCTIWSRASSCPPMSLCHYPYPVQPPDSGVQMTEKRKQETNNLFIYMRNFRVVVYPTVATPTYGGISGLRTPYTVPIQQRNPRHRVGILRWHFCSWHVRTPALNRGTAVPRYIRVKHEKER